MSSELQKSASRNNGAKSNGPVTPEGKARSAANSTTHGLTSSTVVLANESQPLYDQLLDAYRNEWQPQGQTENDLVVEMANARWRLRRIWAMETAAFDGEMFINRSDFDQAFSNPHPALRQVDAFQSMADRDNNFLDKLHRYETRYSRSFERAVRGLVHMQRLRGFDSQAATDPKHDPIAPPPPDLPNEPDPSPATLLQLLQRIVLWLVALVSHVHHTAPSRCRAAMHLARNLNGSTDTTTRNYTTPEEFSWETGFTPKSEAA